MTRGKRVLVKTVREKGSLREQLEISVREEKREAKDGALKNRTIM
jgi:hypothetical protein